METNQHHPRPIRATPSYIRPTTRKGRISCLNFRRQGESGIVSSPIQQNLADRLSQRLRAIVDGGDTPADSDHSITAEELGKSRKTSTDTAPGADGIMYSMIRHFGAEGHAALFQLSNASWNAQALLSDCKRAIIVPIPKPTQCA